MAGFGGALVSEAPQPHSSPRPFPPLALALSHWASSPQTCLSEHRTAGGRGAQAPPPTPALPSALPSAFVFRISPLKWNFWGKGKTHLKALNVFYRRHPPSLANGPTGPASPFGSWCLWGVSGTGNSMGAPADLGPGSHLGLRPHSLPASGTPGQALRLPSSCPSPILTVTSRPGVRDLQSSLSQPTQLSPLQRAQLEGPLGEGRVGPLAEQAWRVRWTPPSTLLPPHRPPELSGCGWAWPSCPRSRPTAGARGCGTWSLMWVGSAHSPDP